MIKLGNQEITLKVGSNDVSAAYLGSTLVYSGGTPPTPTGDYKWLATYSDSHTESAECDASSAITQNEITLTDLASVEIGDCVTSIGGNAFSNCSGLTSVTIGSGVTTIGDGVFFACKSLTDVIIPESVSNIGMSVFNHCTSLASITCLATTPPKLNIWSFDDTDNCPIYVPAQSVSAYKSAARWSTYASRIQAIP